MLHGPQEALGRVPAHARLLVDVEVAAALVVAAVEVLDLGDAGLGRRIAKGIQDVPLDARLLDAPFAAAGVQVVEGVRLQRPLVLVLLEVGQHVVPGPAGIAHLAPQVVVARLPAHVDHAVDGRAAAEHAAARVGQAAAVEAGLRGRLEAPVGARVAHQVEVADGDVDPVVVVLAAGLEEKHARLGIGREAVRQQAARRARADDDVVVDVRRHGCCRVLLHQPNRALYRGKRRDRKDGQEAKRAAAPEPRACRLPNRPQVPPKPPASATGGLADGLKDTSIQRSWEPPRESR